VRSTIHQRLSRQQRSDRLVPFSALAVLCGLLICGYPSELFAADEAQSPEARLQKIAEQISTDSSKVDELKARQKQLSSQQALLQKSVSELRASLEKTKKKMAEHESQRQSVEVEAHETDQRLSSLHSLALERVRALGMQNKGRLFEKLFLSGDGQSFGYRAFLLQKIRAHDSRLTRELQGLFAEKRDQILVLKSLLEQQEKLVNEFNAQQAQLVDKNAKLEKVKIGIQLEKKKIESGLSGLRAEALRLETVMVGLTGGVETEDLREGAQADPVAEGEKKPQTPFTGKGLRSVGHKPPLKGKIVQKFGSVGASGIESFLKNRGIEIEAQEGTQVSAIEQGRVIFNGIMPGYGQIAILDHGDREYSLYGRLGKSSVSIGDIVEKDATFAHVGTKDALGRNFYFEIRKQGKPLDPGLFVAEYKR